MKVYENFFVLVDDVFKNFDSSLEDREVKSRKTRGNVQVCMNYEYFMMFYV